MKRLAVAIFVWKHFNDRSVYSWIPIDHSTRNTVNRFLINLYRMSIRRQVNYHLQNNNRQIVVCYFIWMIHLDSSNTHRSNWLTFVFIHLFNWIVITIVIFLLLIWNDRKNSNMLTVLFSSKHTNNEKSILKQDRISESLTFVFILLSFNWMNILWHIWYRHFEQSVMVINGWSNISFLTWDQISFIVVD